MTGPPPDFDGKAHTRPRWVKVSLISALVVILLAVVLMVAGGGQHGPGRHLPGGKAPGFEEPGNHALPQRGQG